MQKNRSVLLCMLLIVGQSAMAMEEENSGIVGRFVPRAVSQWWHGTSSYSSNAQADMQIAFIRCGTESVTKVTKALKEGADPNRQFYDRNLPLLEVVAIDCKNIQPNSLSLGEKKKIRRDIMKVLIESGADVNKSEEGVFPLEMAAGFGCDDLVKILLENKADPNSAITTSVLDHAVCCANIFLRNGYREGCDASSYERIVKLLLDYDANPFISTALTPGGRLTTARLKAKAFGLERLEKIIKDGMIRKSPEIYSVIMSLRVAPPGGAELPKEIVENELVPAILRAKEEPRIESEKEE